MRLISIGLLSAALGTAACNQAEPSAAAAAGTAKSLTPAAAADNRGSSVAAPDAVKPAALEAREVTIPAGTVIPITLDTSVGSDISRIEQPVAAHVTHGVTVGGRTVLAAGSPVSGLVTDATRSGKVKGRAHVAVRFTSLTAGHDGAKYRIDTAAVGRTAAATKQKDAVKIGAPAAGGAIIGAIAGGKKGAAIGTAVGAGAGTAVVLSTRGEEVHMPKGTALSIRLAEPVTVRVGG